MQLLFYCNVLAMSYITDQRRQRTILFHKRSFRSDNAVLGVLSSLKCNAVCAIYRNVIFPVFNVTEHGRPIKERLWSLEFWTHFVDK